LIWLAWLLFETASDDEPGEDEDEQDDEEEEIRKPKAKIRSLQDHVNRLHKRLEERDSRIKELEDAGNDGRLRVEAAFWRELVTGERRIGDHESAWDLFTARGFADLVKLSDDGEVTDMDVALEKLVERYPWLEDEPIQPDSELEVAMGRRTAPPPKRKSGTTELQFDRAQLQKRMPHLRKHM
jgi:hypothetical protein